MQQLEGVVWRNCAGKLHLRVVCVGESYFSCMDGECLGFVSWERVVVYVKQLCVIGERGVVGERKQLFFVGRSIVLDLFLGMACSS